MQYKISSSAQNLTLVEDFAHVLKSRYNINDDVYPKILISLTEAVTNAIAHGNGYVEDKIVILKHSCQHNKLHIWVQDEGEGFEPNHIPDPTRAENLEKIGGRGVMIMRTLCQEIRYMHGGTCVELVFEI